MAASRLNNWLGCIATIVAVLATGCSSAPTVTAGYPPDIARVDEQSRRTRGQASGAGLQTPGLRAVDTALSMVGAPYRYGGSSPAGFDCSGLVHYAYAAAGKSVPRTTNDLLRASDAIAMRKAEAGDLLFFEISSKADHVGIFIGEGRFVHAPSSGKDVSIASLDDPYWRGNFLSARRLE